MPNMAAMIFRHNKALLAQRTEPANTVAYHLLTAGLKPLKSDGQLMEGKQVNQLTYFRSIIGAHSNVKK